jgi:hypothetical protein
VEINTYALAVVGVLALASCVALGIGLALKGRRHTREHSEHAPGGRLLLPPGASGLWGEHDARAGALGNTFRADEPPAERRRRRRPLTADQQATRDAWARWRAERADPTHPGDD